MVGFQTTLSESNTKLTESKPIEGTAKSSRTTIFGNTSVDVQ